MKLAQHVAIGLVRAKFKFLSAISKKTAAREAFKLFCTPPRRRPRILPDIFRQAETLQFDLDGLNIYGWRWNHPSEMKVLIVHGFESTAVNFERYVNHFVMKGFEVLAFDAPAHGRSEGKRITAPLYASMIIRINELYGPIQSYMAHSFGGLAVSLALEKMDHGVGNRIVLIAPATETTTAIDYFFRFIRLSDGVRKEFDDFIIKSGGVPASWYSIRRALTNINTPVLWLHDEDDDTTPIGDAMKVKDQNNPQISFIITKGLGHRRIYRDNEVMKAIVDFL